jgi:hypothetical protein
MITGTITSDMRSKKEDIDEKRHKTRTIKIYKKRKKTGLHERERVKSTEFDIQPEMSQPRSHTACLDEDLQNFFSGHQGRNRYFSSGIPNLAAEVSL